MACFDLGAVIGALLAGGPAGLFRLANRNKDGSPKQLGGMVNFQLQDGVLPTTSAKVTAAAGAMLAVAFIIGGLHGSGSPNPDKGKLGRSSFYDIFKKRLEMAYWLTRGDIDAAVAKVCNEWGYDLSVAYQVFHGEIEAVRRTDFDKFRLKDVYDDASMRRKSDEIERVYQREYAAAMDYYYNEWLPRFNSQGSEYRVLKPLRGRVFRTRAAFRALKKYYKLFSIQKSYRRQTWGYGNKWQNSAQKWYTSPTGRTLNYTYNDEFRRQFRQKAWRSGYSAGVFDGEIQNLAESLISLLTLDAAAGFSTSGVAECGVGVLWYA